MLLSEQLIAAAFQTQKYFVVQGFKVGVREADILAIRKEDDKFKFFHIECQVSISPSGVLRSKATYGKSAARPAKSAIEYYKKKFRQPKLVKAVSKFFGTKKYERVFVYGKLKNPKQLKQLEKQRVKCISIRDLVSAARKSAIKIEEFEKIVGLVNII